MTVHAIQMASIVGGEWHFVHVQLQPVPESRVIRHTFPTRQNFVVRNDPELLYILLYILLQRQGVCECSLVRLKPVPKVMDVPV